MSGICVEDAVFHLALSQINRSHEKGNSIIRIQCIPDFFCDRPDIVSKGDAGGFAGKRRKRVYVPVVGMNQISFPGQRLIIGIGEADTGGGISVIALYNG